MQSVLKVSSQPISHTKKQILIMNFVYDVWLYSYNYEEFSLH